MGGYQSNGIKGDLKDMFQYLKIPFALTELFHSTSYGSGTCINPLTDKEEGVEGGGDVGCFGGR